MTAVIWQKLHRERHGLRTPNEAFFHKNPKLGLGQSVWADELLVIWGILGQFFSAHFGSESLGDVFHY